MKSIRTISIVFLLILMGSPTALFSADFFQETLKKGLPQLPGIGGFSVEQAVGTGLDDGTIASGLKEALAVGTKNAVGVLSRINGYFSNAAIRIPLPDKLQMAANLLGKVGYQRQVDDFILSMNRAAENAAPKAAAYFAEAIKEMTVDDARRILNGGETAATDYFASKTTAELYAEFRPIIGESMNRMGVVRAYNAMLGKVPDLPFANPEALDLDHYITKKALDGLFHTVAQEERKIRTNPLARSTELLKTVFGK